MAENKNADKLKLKLSKSFADHFKGPYAGFKSAGFPHGIRERADNMEFYRKVFNAQEPKTLSDLVMALYDAKRAAGCEPEGWILGSTVVEQLRDQYNCDLSRQALNSADMQDQTLMGLPYFIDTQTPNRLEIIA